MVEEYSKLDIYEGDSRMKLNGSQTLRENYADVLGLLASYKLYRQRQANDYVPEEILLKDKDKLFFSTLGTSILFCSKGKATKTQAWVNQFGDEHTRGANRLNGLLKLFPWFAGAFNCSKNSPMASGHRCINNYKPLQQFIP